MTHRCILLFILIPLLAGCGLYEQGSDIYEGDPPDLTVEQTPNDTVRAGTRLRYTAAFADSLNPKYAVLWFFRDDKLARGRVAEWVAPVTPGEYRHSVRVESGSRSAGHDFSTVVVP